MGPNTRQTRDPMSSGVKISDRQQGLPGPSNTIGLYNLSVPNIEWYCKSIILYLLIHDISMLEDGRNATVPGTLFQGKHPLADCTKLSELLPFQGYLPIQYAIILDLTVRIDECFSECQTGPTRITRFRSVTCHVPAAATTLTGCRSS